MVATTAAAAPVFTDVTTAAGVGYVQHVKNTPPGCLITLAQPPDLPMPDLECAPERWSGAAAAGDHDGDGWVDLFVGVLDGPDLLLRNRGDGTFADVAAAAGLPPGLASNGAAWADLDNDGDLDLYVVTIADTRFYLLVNDGSGHFTEEAMARGAAVDNPNTHTGSSVAVGDYDRDGWTDLFIAEWRSNAFAAPGAPSNARLLHNLGPAQPGHFEDVTVAAGVSLTGVHPKGVFAFAPAFVDLDIDGWPDLAVASDIGASRLFWNNRDGTFIDGTVAAAVGTDAAGMGSTFGDWDGDGDLDWFVTAIFCVPPERGPSCSGNRLYRYDGGRLFTDVTDFAGVRDGNWGWGAVFFDRDNDGDLDLAETNGMDMPVWTLDDDWNTNPMLLWDNNGLGDMIERGAAVGVTDARAGKGLLTFDYDRDGDLDLFVVNNGDGPVLYRNDGGNTTGDWLRVEIRGLRSNRDGLNARATLTALPGGQPQVREVGVRSHFQGQSENTLHFGLGPAPGAPVEEVRLRFPASGVELVRRQVPRNTTLWLCEPADTGTLKVARRGAGVALWWQTGPEFLRGYGEHRFATKTEIGATCGRRPELVVPEALPVLPAVDPAIPAPGGITFLQVASVY